MTHSSSRRAFIGSLIEQITVFALCKAAWVTRAAQAAVAPEVTRWIQKTDELALALRRGKVTQNEWAEHLVEHYRKIDLSEFLRLIDFEKLVKLAKLPAVGELFQAYDFPVSSGLPRKLSFYRDIAGFRKGTSIPPHGHNHLVSSFLVLKGELRGRHFNRLRDETNSLCLAPSLDRSFRAGDFSTVTQEKNNVHWFTALTDGAFIFDIGVGGLPSAGTTVPLPNPNPLKSGRIYLDMERPELTPDGLSRVARISEQRAYELFG